MLVDTTVSIVNGEKPETRIFPPKQNKRGSTNQNTRSVRTLYENKNKRKTPAPIQERVTFRGRINELGIHFKSLNRIGEEWYVVFFIQGIENRNSWRN